MKPIVDGGGRIRIPVVELLHRLRILTTALSDERGLTPGRRSWNARRTDFRLRDASFVADGNTGRDVEGLVLSRAIGEMKLDFRLEGTLRWVLPKSGPISTPQRHLSVDRGRSMLVSFAADA